MNNTVVSNAIGTFEQLIGKAKDALRQIERDVFGRSGYEPAGVYEDPHAAMSTFLKELHDILLVVLEAADMPQTRASLIESWPKFVSAKGGLENVKEDHQFEYCESAALTFLDRLIHGLRLTIAQEISSEDVETLNRLEAMLRDTAALVHRRQINPQNEHDVQFVMHDYLSASFSDFRLNPPIGGSLKNFKPDCGVASVGAAIEFKIVHTKEEMSAAFSGVAEDTAGYKGSKDWTRFYAVIYQAQPFALESHLKNDLKRIGAATWTGILVNGPTAKQKKRAKKDAQNKSKPSKKGAA